MANAVSPSDVKLLTRGQAGKFADLVVAAALKLGLPSEPTQQVLESQGAVLADECALQLRRRVERSDIERERFGLVLVCGGWDQWRAVCAACRQIYDDVVVSPYIHLGEAHVAMKIDVGTEDTLKSIARDRAVVALANNPPDRSKRVAMGIAVNERTERCVVALLIKIRSSFWKDEITEIIISTQTVRQLKDDCYKVLRKSLCILNS